jgi:hypothetical protein
VCVPLHTHAHNIHDSMKHITVVASSCFLLSTFFWHSLSWRPIPLTFHGSLDIALPSSLLSHFHPFFWCSHFFWSPSSQVFIQYKLLIQSGDRGFLIQWFLI